MDLLQYAHFLASAYVVVVLLRGHEQILLVLVLRPVVKCGQQALSIFTSGIVLSYVGGMVFDHAGTGFRVQLLVNGITFGLLIAIAYGVAWFKNAPWKRRGGGAAAVAGAVAMMIVGARPATAAEYELHKLPWQGIERSYLLHVPPVAAEKAGGRPLVIALHAAALLTAAGCSRPACRMEACWRINWRHCTRSGLPRSRRSRRRSGA